MYVNELPTLDQVLEQVETSWNILLEDKCAGRIAGVSSGGCSIGGMGHQKCSPADGVQSTVLGSQKSGTVLLINYFCNINVKYLNIIMR
jgi:hypothetical protein